MEADSHPVLFETYVALQIVAQTSALVSLELLRGIAGTMPILIILSGNKTKKFGVRLEFVSFPNVEVKMDNVVDVDIDMLDTFTRWGIDFNLYQRCPQSRLTDVNLIQRFCQNGWSYYSVHIGNQSQQMPCCYFCKALLKDEGNWLSCSFCAHILYRPADTGCGTECRVYLTKGPHSHHIVYDVATQDFIVSDNNDNRVTDVLRRIASNLTLCK